MVDQLPTEGENGMFEGRQTYWDTCHCDNPECNRPTSYYCDTDEVCMEQTAEMREGDTGLLLPTIEMLGPELGGALLLMLAQAGDPEALKIIEVLEEIQRKERASTEPRDSHPPMTGNFWPN